VEYQGEGGQDAGGLFRDSVTHICTELQTTALPLFVPCPNFKSKFGDNQEKFIPNPSSKSSLHLSMFAFVGKLMGMAIRGGHILNLDLPSLVWKPLVGESIDRTDLEAIDALCFDVLEKVENIDTQDVTPETFSDFITNSFVTASSDGREIELKENGEDIPVTWENRHEYVQLVQEYRLNEFGIQIAAIKRGLASIVPVRLLPLFTWQELEMMVCGKREIDIEYLKRNTRYRNPVTEGDAHVALMWQALESYNHDERQMFLRFVWGQSRLPYNPADFTQKFEVMGAPYVRPGQEDKMLPKSHTCFFSLELPQYTNLETMKAKLLYAVKNCQSIDTDFAVQNVDWEADD